MELGENCNEIYYMYLSQLSVESMRHQKLKYLLGLCGLVEWDRMKRLLWSRDARWPVAALCPGRREFWILLFFFEAGEKITETEQEVKCRAWRQPESER